MATQAISSLKQPNPNATLPPRGEYGQRKYNDRLLSHKGGVGSNFNLNLSASGQNYSDMGNINNKEMAEINTISEKIRQQVEYQKIKPGTQGTMEISSNGGYENVVSSQVFTSINGSIKGQAMKGQAN